VPLPASRSSSLASRMPPPGFPALRQAPRASPPGYTAPVQAPLRPLCRHPWS
jgi:hypothetical protein